MHTKQKKSQETEKHRVSLTMCYIACVVLTLISVTHPWKINIK